MNHKNKQAKIIGTLRLLARQWEPKRQARKNNQVKIQEGNFKNGNPKYVTYNVCEICKGTFGPKEVHMDHVDPVVDPESGFVDWNTYIDRLLVDTECYQALCKPCHKKKSKEENSRRTRK